MTYLLYLLLFAFLGIETPLIALMVYLYNHSTNDPLTSQMRRIIFIIAFAKALFILAQIVLVFDSLIKISQFTIIVIWSYSITAIFLAAVDWWALWKIRSLIK